MGDFLPAVDLGAGRAVAPCALGPAVWVTCPAGSYSTAVGASNSTTCTPCPAGSDSASSGRAECLSLTTSTTSTSSTTPAPLSTVVVSFVAAVQMSAADFDGVKAGYIAGVAVALGRAEADVRIVSVVSAIGRRRASARALVKTGVTVPAEEAESVSRAVTPDNLNAALGSRGITVAEVTEVSTAAAASTTTPT
jgi:hypothetical protein